jgi:hypothetical protein
VRPEAQPERSTGRIEMRSRLPLVNRQRFQGHARTRLGNIAGFDDGAFKIASQIGGEF